MVPCTVPILQEGGWAPGPVWTDGKSRPHRDSIPDRPAHSSVAIPTETKGSLVLSAINTAYNCSYLTLAGTHVKTDVQTELKGKGKGRGKAIPLQSWTGPENSRGLRFPDFKTFFT